MERWIKDGEKIQFADVRSYGKYLCNKPHQFIKGITIFFRCLFSSLDTFLYSVYLGKANERSSLRTMPQTCPCFQAQLDIFLYIYSGKIVSPSIVVVC